MSEIDPNSAARSVQASRRENTLRRVSGSNIHVFIFIVEEYEDEIRDLTCASNDADALYSAFLKIGVPTENIVLLASNQKYANHPTKEHFDKGFNGFLQNLHEGDLAVVVLGGHGAEFPEESSSYLLPANAQIFDESGERLSKDAVKSSSISIDAALQELADSQASFRWMFVDACRDDPTQSESSRAIGIRTFGIDGQNKLKTIVNVPQSVALLQSASTNECSYEGGTYRGKRIENGLCTYALLEALDPDRGLADSNHDGVVTFNDVVGYVLRQTPVYAKACHNRPQHPTLSGNNIGDFIFFESLIDGVTRAKYIEAELLYKEAFRLKQVKRYFEAQRKITTALAIRTCEKYELLAEALTALLEKQRDDAFQLQKEAAIQQKIREVEAKRREAEAKLERERVVSEQSSVLSETNAKLDWFKISVGMIVGVWLFIVCCVLIVVFNHSSKQETEVLIDSSETQELDSVEPAEPKVFDFSEPVKQQEPVAVEPTKPEVPAPDKSVNPQEPVAVEPTKPEVPASDESVKPQEPILIEPAESEVAKPEEPDKPNAIVPITPISCYPDLWSKATKGGERNGLAIDGKYYALRYCPSTGEEGFLMGTPTSEPDRYDNETQHQAILTEGFWLLETEVTQKLWKSVMGAKPSYFKGDELPVESVSWDDCAAFVEKLNAKGCAPKGWRFSLPTETQWEYACRAGSDEPYGGLALDETGWYEDNSDGKTHDVGLKRPNAWGLYDMCGNVGEWCLDYLDEYPTGPATDPCQTSGSKRVLRGGSWSNYARRCRSAYRLGNDPSEQNQNCGLRVALIRPSRIDDKPSQNVVESVSCDLDLWSKARKGGERNGLSIKGEKYAFRYCSPTGSKGFLMGSPSRESGRDDNELQHKTILTEGFWLLETEITQKLWTSVMGTDPSYFKGDDRPVESVDWDECVAFVEELNSKGYAPKGWMFSLPTEAQWEYACRAGSDKPYGGGALDEVGWYSDNAKSETHKVGLKRPNAWGLFDMHGNVGEWCLDYSDDYTSETAIDPCLTSGAFHAFRGGGWFDFAEDCRSARRIVHKSSFKDWDCGARLALVPQPYFSNEPTEPSDVVFTNGPVSCEPRLWSKADKAGERNGLKIKGANYPFRYCPPTGSKGVKLGSPTREPGRFNNETPHNVVLTEGFWLLETEITQKLWSSVMGDDPSYFKGKDRPVDNVSWNDCDVFIMRLNSGGYAPKGWRFTLPTEAQWEYACRAGGVEPYGGRSLDEVGWHIDNANQETHEVGLKRPNAWGLYDMHGNVSEWCRDFYDDYPVETVTDPCQTSGSYLALRGGSWLDLPDSCRCAARSSNYPDRRRPQYGARLALVRQ